MRKLIVELKRPQISGNLPLIIGTKTYITRKMQSVA